MSRLLSVVALGIAACLFVGASGCTNTKATKTSTAKGAGTAADGNKMDKMDKAADKMDKAADKMDKAADKMDKADKTDKNGKVPPPPTDKTDKAPPPPTDKTDKADKKDKGLSAMLAPMNRDFLFAAEATLISGEQYAHGARRGHRRGCGAC